MLKIRLRRTGKRNQASYRIVIVEAKSKRDGKYVEMIGRWHPGKKELKINKKRYAYWLGVGAQPTAVVKKLHEKAR